jgi:hypothetical protein
MTPTNWPFDKPVAGAAEEEAVDEVDADEIDNDKDEAKDEDEDAVVVMEVGVAEVVGTVTEDAEEDEVEFEIDTEVVGVAVVVIIVVVGGVAVGVTEGASVVVMVCGVGDGRTMVGGSEVPPKLYNVPNGMLGPKYVGGMYTMVVEVVTGTPAPSVMITAEGNSHGGNPWEG